MTYFYVKFLKKNSDSDFSSGKEYLYKTRETVLVGEVLDSFERVDNFIPYSNKARVTRIVSENEAINSNIDIKEVIINAKHLAKDAIVNNDTAKVFINKETGANLGLKLDDSDWITISGYPNFIETTPLNTLNYPSDICSSHTLNFTSPEIKTNTENKKEKTMNMNSIFKNMNLDFGKVIGNQIAYSVKGMAVGANVGTAQESYKTYDGEITDVTGLVIKDMPLYKMPVAIKDISEGDMVMHQGRAVIVEATNDDGTLVVVDVANATETTIFPVKNIFGFNFYTKIVNPFNGMLGEVNDNNPFGNMLPFMMLMDTSSADKSDMLMMAMMMGQTCADMNMLMPFMLLGGNGETGEKNDVLTMMMAMNMMNANKVNKEINSDEE